MFSRHPTSLEGLTRQCMSRWGRGVRELHWGLAITTFFAARCGCHEVPADMPSLEVPAQKCVLESQKPCCARSQHQQKAKWCTSLPPIHSLLFANFTSAL